MDKIDHKNEIPYLFVMRSSSLSERVGDLESSREEIRPSLRSTRKGMRTRQEEA
jgi:hypothetical protein